MVNLGNAWHIPGNPEPAGRAGMRDPVDAIDPATAVTIFSGNQFQGAGNPGNQWQIGSSLFVRRTADAAWTEFPLIFQSAAGNNKYYAATIPANTFQAGDVVQYYLRIAYDDHDTTFVHVSDDQAVTAADEAAARLAPFTYFLDARTVKGQWGPVFKFPNVAIHASVLPNGLVLMWGRRDGWDQSLDVHECTPFLWDPANRGVSNTPQPTLADGTKVNLFCSGHAFLPDGRLLVVGGHKADGDGLSQATLYEWATNTWTPTTPMTTAAGEPVGRWYPTATTLPDGTVLVLSGTYIDLTRPAGKQVVLVDLLQVWEEGIWKTIKQADGTPLNFIGLPLYPRMHVASDGRVFMSGTNDRTLRLKTSEPGEWTEVGLRANGNRDYCPAVQYDGDKIIYIGGGNDNDTHTPTAATEIIDLEDPVPRWRPAAAMTFRRRQHNATVLPDGTVLVTGGTQGGGGPNNGFNDLGPNQPVHLAELWEPKGGQGGVWTALAAEAVDRCYHAIAVLLPDATVLSAGGGEYRPDNVHANDPKDSHRDAQVFSPPYLFKGGRPDITAAPASVSYGESFQVGTSLPDDVGKVTWIRLPSVTHSFDQSQRINVLLFVAGSGALTVTAPNSANVCPPGHYMMFILNKAGVPSIARIIQMRAAVAPAAVPAAPARLLPLRAALSEPRACLQVWARETAVREAATGTAVVVGITGTCPYGIGACWGGAYEALGRLEGVALVSPIPNTDDSTAEVFLKDERLPALDRWDAQFRSIVNGTYVVRGVEVALRGIIEERDGRLLLGGAERRPPIQLAPMAAAERIQWNHTAQTRKPMEEGEALAYEELGAAFRSLADGQRVTVTGPLIQTDIGYRLHVRLVRL